MNAKSIFGVDFTGSFLDCLIGCCFGSSEDEELDEDTVMMEALEAGASDFEAEGEVMTVYTEVDDVAAVSDALTAAGYKLLSAQVEMLPQNGYVKLTNEDDIKNMQKMLDMFEDNDDVQNVWHNWEQE